MLVIHESSDAHHFVLIRMVTRFISLDASSFSSPVWATAIAGFSVVATLFLSTYLIFQHLNAYKNPEEQKFLLGVILMVPCYSIESYVSMLNPSLSVDCGILRDCYEAFAMYCFGRYFVACLGGEERTIEFMNREGGSASTVPLLEHSYGKGIIHHHFPMNYILKPWRVGEWFYQLIKFGIFQYMIIKTVTAILSVVLEAFGSYCEGEFKWKCGSVRYVCQVFGFYRAFIEQTLVKITVAERKYPYMAVVLNFSQYWALYCLIQFYTTIKDELAHMKPLAKFLVFKSIVFLTWWQGVIIAVMDTFGLLRSPFAQRLQFKSSIQDFIICIEMFVASVVHLYVFPSKPYELLGDWSPGNVSVLGDYASADCPVDPDEVRDSERPTKLKLPQPEISDRGRTNIRESVRDFVIGGGEYIVNDFKFTVNQAVEPMEKSFTKLNKKLKKISQNIKRNERKATRDDSFIRSTGRVIRGIDDPLLNGSASDSVVSRARGSQRRSGYASAESGGESSSDQGYGNFEIQGTRWVTKE